MRSLGHMITPIIKHAADTVDSSLTRKHLQRCAAVRFHRSNLVKKLNRWNWIALTEINTTIYKGEEKSGRKEGTEKNGRLNEKGLTISICCPFSIADGQLIATITVTRDDERRI